MAIKRTTAFVASDGTLFSTIEEVRKRELQLLALTHKEKTGCDVTDGGSHLLVSWIVENADAILDILTTGPRSRPAARKKAGTTAPKRAVGRRATKEVAAAGFAAMHAAVDAEPETVPA